MATPTVNLRVDDPNPVLVIDDDEDLLRMYEKALMGALPDRDIHTGKNVSEGLGLLDTRTPSLLITDLHFPDGDGLEIIIRCLNDHPSTPVIAISAFPALSEVREFLKDYTNLAFLPKPFDVDMFTSLSRQLISGLADGQVQGINIIDLLQMAEQEAKTCQFEVHFDNRTGWLTVNNGKLVHAVTSQSISTGREALYDILQWSKPIIFIYSSVASRKHNLENITIHNLLLDYCVMRDSRN